jgi:hypothetical protein
VLVVGIEQKLEHRRRKVGLKDFGQIIDKVRASDRCDAGDFLLLAEFEIGRLDPESSAKWVV